MERIQFDLPLRVFSFPFSHGIRRQARVHRRRKADQVTTQLHKNHCPQLHKNQRCEFSNDICILYIHVHISTWQCTATAWLVLRNLSFKELHTQFMPQSAEIYWINIFNTLGSILMYLDTKICLLDWNE
jgi:hypothetical protein